MSSLEDRLRAYFTRRAGDPSIAMLDRDEPPLSRPQAELPRRRRRLVAAAGGAVVILGLAGALVLLMTREDARNRQTVHAGPSTTAPAITPSPTPTGPPDPNAPFRWPDQCLPPAQGSERVDSPDLLADRPVPSWTTSESGEWLRARIKAAGLPEPYSVGSAWVVMHGVDGVVVAWFGPPRDAAGLSLQRVDGVESAELTPEQPFTPDAYRPPIADSVKAGGVRLWFLTHPRDGYDALNFPRLTTAPCLPNQAAIRQTLSRVGDAANDQPYRGALPGTAGRLRVASNSGISVKQPGDEHLIQVGERALGRPLTLPGFTGPVLAGQDVFVYTTIPPTETDSVSLASTEFPANPRAAGAGGLDLMLFVQSQRAPDEANIEDAQRIAAALNRDPYLGQPAP
jgi:hypothetical protein